MQNQKTETTTSEIDDLVNTLARTANFMRGMSLDPGLPMDRRDALEKRANEIDEFVTKHIK